MLFRSVKVLVSGLKTGPLMNVPAAVLLAGLLSGCQQEPVAGEVTLPGAEADWSGFRAQWVVDGVPGESVPVTADGHFQLPLPPVDDADAVIVEVSQGRYRLRALPQVEPLTVSAETTARLALADTNNDGVISAAEAGSYRSMPATATADMTMIVHSVLYTPLAAGMDLNRDAPLLERYADSWKLARAVAHSPQHMTAFRLRYHDQLARSYALLHNDPEFASSADPLNPEQTLMLRLDDTGKPLPWQHLDFTAGRWACVDYFEKGKRHPEIIGQWPLGVRLWAVGEELQGALQQSRAQAIIRAYNSASRCGYQGWRLPTRLELKTLTDRKSGEWDFPRSLPFSGAGRFWVSTEQGGAQVFDLQNDAMVEGAGEAQVLPFSFTADAPPPVKERRTTPVDLQALRAIYSRSSAQWPAPAVDAGVHWQELGSLPAVPFPAENPYSEEKVALGQTLFFDTGLSAKGNTACASCHLPDQQWSDQRKVSVGSFGKEGVRNAMPIQNTAYNTSLFWDGRVVTLEEQSIHPILDRLEMALTLDELLEKIKANPVYPDLFRAAFGDAEITLQRYKQAVATFERTLISRPAALDRFLAGEPQAMSDQQIWGMHLYRTKARCMNCHSGPALTDYTFRNTGLTWYGRSLEDEARFNQTFNISDMGAFRVPSLRDITFSAPYMHNGVFRVLARERSDGSVAGVIPMYNAGMTKGRNANYPQYRHKYDPFFPVVDDLIQPLGLSNQEMLAVGAFLEAVSATPRTAPAPFSVLQEPRSELTAGQATETSVRGE